MKSNVNFTDCYGQSHTEAIIFISAITCTVNEYKSLMVSDYKTDSYTAQADDNARNITYEVCFYPNQTLADNGFPPMPYQRINQEHHFMETNFQFTPEDDIDLDDTVTLVEMAEQHFFSDILNIPIG